MLTNDLRNTPDNNAGSAHGRGRLGSVIRGNPKTGERHLDKLVWGLLPQATKDPDSGPRPLNARAETVATHPMFAAAFRNRRGIVPMSVYYQQRTSGGSKQVFAISRRDGESMAVAGLWDAFRWPDGELTRSYCIITTEPTVQVAPIHDRMPVVLEKEDWPVWLGESSRVIPHPCCIRRRPTSFSAGRLVNVAQDRSAISCEHTRHAARLSLSSLLPLATIFSASSGRGLCNVSASVAGAVIQTSISARAVRITGIALGW